ncbi:MAG: hypothetical protein AAF993_10420 [Pseudomonadota bacterium]
MSKTFSYTTPRNHATVLPTALTIVLLLSACGESTPSADANTPVSDTAAAALPPGFTDAPPPPPTSSTQILSGGTLLAEPPVADAVVVITNGQLVAWGKRGEVEVPNDSIGFDVRGMWLQAGPAVSLKTGQAANLEIYSTNPASSGAQPKGYVKGAEISLPESE